MSDPEIPDFARYGRDLLERIEELTKPLTEEQKDGWRPLLAACEREIRHLQAVLKAMSIRALEEVAR